MMSQKDNFKKARREDDLEEFFECEYCSYGTNNIDQLDEHIQMHEDSLKIVEEEEKLKKIEDDINNTKEEVLSEIKKYEKSRRGRKRKGEVSSDDWYKCGICPYKTKRKHDLPKHFLTHCNLDTATVYRCSECNYETKRKNDMPKHMLGHCTKGVPLYKCPDCPYQTKRKNDLPKHLLCHKPPETVTLWYCAHCSYCTKRKGDLHKHELTHLSKDQLEEHRCSECKYVTKRKNDLHKHMLVHCDRHIEGVFKCLKCSYATDKVHKFSKHALSNCSYWQDPKNTESMNLEDILADADRDGVHVILDDENGECYVELDDEIVEAQAEYEYQEADGSEETFELIEEIPDETQEYVTLDNSYVLQEHQYEYVNQPEQSTNENEGEVSMKNVTFNFNLGEFTVDEEEAPNSEENQVTEEQ